MLYGASRGSIKILQVTTSSQPICTPKYTRWSEMLFPDTDLQFLGIKFFKMRESIKFINKAQFMRHLSLILNFWIDHNLDKDNIVVFCKSTKFSKYDNNILSQNCYSSLPATSGVFSRTIANFLYCVNQTSKSNMIEPHLQYIEQVALSIKFQQEACQNSNRMYKKVQWSYNQAPYVIRTQDNVIASNKCKIQLNLTSLVCPRFIQAN